MRLANRRLDDRDRPLHAAVQPILTAATGTGWLDELERVAKLHAVGALTDEEFGLAKSKLLGAA